MGHIINIVNFLLEITFGRQPSRKNGKRTIIFLVVTVVLAGSLAGNVLMFREVYDLTAKDIAQRRELARLATVEGELKTITNKYDALMDLLRTAEELPTAPAVTPQPPPTTPKKKGRPFGMAYPGPERPPSVKKAGNATEPVMD